MNSSIAVVLPCYNEVSVISETIRPLVEENYTVIVVDDGSKDGSGQAVAGEPVYLVRHLTNLGQGAALQTGAEFALRLPHVRAIVHFDADGQHSHKEIPSMVSPILNGQADVVLGSRFLDNQSNVPLRKRILLKGACWVNFMFTGLSLSDAHNGFRAMSCEAAACLTLSEPGFAHASELLWLIRKNQLRFVELPTNVRYTEYSMSKGQSVLNSLNILWDLILLRLLK